MDVKTNWKNSGFMLLGNIHFFLYYDNGALKPKAPDNWEQLPLEMQENHKPEKKEAQRDRHRRR